MRREVKYIADPFPHVIVENMYNEDVQKLIWTELDYFLASNSLMDAEVTSSAYVPGGDLLKRNKALFLDSYYQDRNNSIILEYNRDLFNDEIKQACWNHWALKPLLTSTNDSTLVSYYEKEHQYHPHWDASVVTALTHFYREPKSFTGGELLFPEFDFHYECVHNRTIIFPSSIVHGVTTVTAEEGLGRWTITQFMGYWK
jgi:hypothetical protein